MGKIKTKIGERKARRQEKRNIKKKRSRHELEDVEEDDENHETLADDDDDDHDNNNNKNHGSKSSKKSKKAKKSTMVNESSMTLLEQRNDPDDPYANLDPSVAAQLRNEDAEIAELEEKLGIGSKKEKMRLNKEYAKLEGYGDDFGDFLDDLDVLVKRVTKGGVENDYKEGSDDDDDYYDEPDDEPDYLEESEPDEEVVPMKDAPIYDEDEDDNSQQSDDTEEASEKDKDTFDDDESRLGDQEEEEEDEDDDDEAEGTKKMEPDHRPRDTYKPSSGEDIYGKPTDKEQTDSTPAKYVPPHLRNKEDTEDRQEKLRVLKRLLNNALNRLSEDTLISVAQQVATIYQSYPTSDVNENLWKNVVSAAVDRPIVMSTMIPVYVGCLVGVHLQTGDTVQLGGFLLEQMTTRLWKVRSTTMEDESKEASNLILCICYLYNFGLVHAVFMFDVIRNLIESFSELDIELLLIILSHSGHALRSDDPLALKEIVISVQKRQSKSDYETSSRVEYMISAMNDLKNNKRRKQDLVYSERTSKLRKFLGRIKTETSRSTESSFHRIRLQDILDVETKGRWWKVGASWVGNQFKHNNDDGNDKDDAQKPSKAAAAHGQEEEELLKLASKYRMNTDSRRSIFCIIMGSADCDDAFEKLVRSGMLKNRSERDCVRVLVECCGNEGNYNPFYSHLASRICDYQPQCKFTFQLAFWDTFKQWESVSLRKAANLAKLLYHLVAVHQSLKIAVLKTIDMTDLEETGLIFVTIFFSTMFESIEDPATVFDLFERGIPKPKVGQDEDEEDLRHSLSVFFLQTLKSSPKNKKKSKFRSNLKAAIKACETNELNSIIPSK